jgi:hypothetical protein
MQCYATTVSHQCDNEYLDAKVHLQDLKEMKLKEGGQSPFERVRRREKEKLQMLEEYISRRVGRNHAHTHT